MSDQEKKSGGSTTGGSPVVMVEQSTASRHKQPYRPNDLQDEAPPDHHKRSRAPAVPTLTEEFKDTFENPTVNGKEPECAVPSEKHKHNVAKKLSSTKKRDTSPDPIKSSPIELELQKTETIAATVAAPAPALPIPAVVPSAAIDIEKGHAERKSDEDSITEEIAELRTSESHKKSGEWGKEKGSDTEVRETDEAVPLQRKFANDIVETNFKIEQKDDEPDPEPENTVPLQRKLGSEIINDGSTSSHLLKKKEISWSDATYLDKVPLEDLSARSAAWMLERKTSVGPCYRKTMPYGEPSGITICLPKKSFKSLNEIVNPRKSGISITVSKRCIDSAMGPPVDELKKNARGKTLLKEKKVELKIADPHYVNFFENIKGKVDNFCGKVKHVMHL
ncbi:uncharacterized protein LOC113498895 isoform X2 [Trichoplusia ni]|uniref:Uncharacterized protein LOC113498895 isoform X2 n=1 Tax=Trichoplusia ni TaxID=7111 RepID=A0A7E5W2M7_TRINI|nr:uncharacterized protein LOC113498895 isoform X2 [Trichoplusia ni]